MLGLGGFPSSWPLRDHKRPLSFRGLLSATDPFRSLTFTNFRRRVLPLLRTLLCMEATLALWVTSPPRLMPARAPLLWEKQDATLGEDDPQAQSAPEYEFVQRIAW